jgi:hypothetical protein
MSLEKMERRAAAAIAPSARPLCSTQTQTNLKPRQGRHTRASFLACFEEVSRIVFHIEPFQ